MAGRDITPYTMNWHHTIYSLYRDTSVYTAIHDIDIGEIISRDIHNIYGYILRYVSLFTIVRCSEFVYSSRLH